MPVCVECAESLPEISKIENGVRIIAICTNCKRPCDSYAEMDGVQNTIAVVLLHPKAYRHNLFNAPNLIRPLIIMVLLSCMLESYVGLVQTSYLSFYREHIHLLRGNQLSEVGPYHFENTNGVVSVVGTSEGEGFQNVEARGGGGPDLQQKQQRGQQAGGSAGGVNASSTSTSTTSSSSSFKDTAQILLSQAVEKSLATVKTEEAANAADEAVCGAAIGSVSGKGADTSADSFGAETVGGNNNGASSSSSTSSSSSSPSSATSMSAFEHELNLNRTMYLIQRYISRRPTLKLVNVVNQYMNELRVVPFTTQLPKLFLYELLEFGFLFLVVTWLGSIFINHANYPVISDTSNNAGKEKNGKAIHNNSNTVATATANTKTTSSSTSATTTSAAGAKQQQQARRHSSYRVMLRALSMSTASKLGYTIFLIWDMPLYLVLVVEAYQCLILFTAMIAAKASYKASVVMTVVTILARYLFRTYLKTLPPFLASVALQIMIVRS